MERKGVVTTYSDLGLEVLDESIGYHLRARDGENALSTWYWADEGEGAFEKTVLGVVSACKTLEQIARIAEAGAYTPEDYVLEEVTGPIVLDGDDTRTLPDDSCWEPDTGEIWIVPEARRELPWDVLKGGRGEQLKSDMGNGFG